MPITQLASTKHTDESCRTFILQGEGHTLGNALRCIISGFPDVEFCAYTVPHPMEASMHFRIQMKKGRAVDALKRGEGSYAKVYLAEYHGHTDDKNKPRQLACKIVDTQKAPKDFVKKFLPRELDILVKINHPHLIHVHSIFQRKSKYYIFMRFAENGDLLEFILKKGSISEAQSRVWMRQLALAVQYLHDMEIAHRDLKCENALITSNYNLKVSDFGFARYVTDAYGKRLTSDTYCGSLSYAAPEILKGSPYHPKVADIWSLGVILYIMLNKAMPFDDTNIKRLHEQQTSRQWKFRSKVVDILSMEVKKLMNHLLEPDVTKRWKIDQVLNSDWFAMDPRLNQLNPAEQAAMMHAQEEKKKYIETLKKKAAPRSVKGEGSNKDVAVLKKENEQPDREKFANLSVPSIMDEDYK
ncbi:Pkinase, and/or RNA pol L 2 domain containing protein [Asbolus verrucosus]|uniref:DNA-directed RNA polymerase I subunit D n=1 Tax=Asbolus verrucosus TaxID=1661398 RepID=A0A482VR03_ASBVE|nr:Pkinase, and/or RNA pol L 2 domain containing protein [Asbolus verrucosus]